VSAFAVVSALTVESFFTESVVTLVESVLVESVAVEDDLLLQAAKEKAIATAKTPTLNEFFMFEI
jgi:hypothetical protein